MLYKEGCFLLIKNFRVLWKVDQYGINQTLNKHHFYTERINAGDALLLKHEYNYVYPELRALQEEKARSGKIKFECEHEALSNLNLCEGVSSRCFFI